LFSCCDVRLGPGDADCVMSG